MISTLFFRIDRNIEFLLAIHAKRVSGDCSLIAARALFGIGRQYQKLTLGFFASLVIFRADGFENHA